MRLAGVFMVAAALSGCMGTGLDLAGSVDPSIATASIPAVAKAGPDAVTVQQAVTSADLDTLRTNPIPWANSDTGSAGVISRIEEDVAAGKVCRSFVTSRHSYEGIAQFNGSTCRNDKGQWYLTGFAPRS